ncbi:MAG: polyprenyl synthetase family protein [Planctomycetes bacterium]|nr:polyprenyl synthetase family protein [Planctomycetota bacterium]
MKEPAASKSAARARAAPQRAEPEPEAEPEAAPQANLERVSVIPELERVYEPIETQMAALNDYLATEFSSTEPFLHELLMHVAHYRGKQIRPACLFLAARAVGGRISRDHVKCAAVIELIHTATLVHDDVLDEAKLRRRVETVNRRWGERAAVLIGDFIYSRGFTISTEVQGVSGMLAATTHTICEGELLQVGSAFQFDLSEATYLEIIRKKTAVLYGIACRIGARLSGASETVQQIFDEYGQALGMAFQISDDALDLTGDEHVVGKSLGTDILKGKMTLPLIRAREIIKGGKLEEYLWLLKTPHAQGAQVRVLRMLATNGVLDDVHRASVSYVNEAASILDRLSENKVRESFEALERFITERRQ